MFQSVGERLNQILRYMMEKIKSNDSKLFKFKNKNVSNFELIIVQGMLTLILVITASHVFHIYEGWNYFDCFWYSLISLTTIGKLKTIFNFKTYYWGSCKENGPDPKKVQTHVMYSQYDGLGPHTLNLNMVRSGYACLNLNKKFL